MRWALHVLIFNLARGSSDDQLAGMINTEISRSSYFILQNTSRTNDISVNPGNTNNLTAVFPAELCCGQSSPSQFKWFLTEYTLWIHGVFLLACSDPLYLPLLLQIMWASRLTIVASSVIIWKDTSLNSQHFYRFCFNLSKLASLWWLKTSALF